MVVSKWWSDFQNLRILLYYTLIGGLIGLVVVHPLTLTVLWLELTEIGISQATYLEFMQGRLWLGLVPRRIIMGSVYLSMGGLLGFGFGNLTRIGALRMKESQFFSHVVAGTIREIVAAGESGLTEFKSSVRWDFENNCTNKSLEKVIAKSIAGFMNNRGGNLVIGVSDDGTIVGLENDYKTLKHKNRDGFERQVIDIIRKYLGGDLCPEVHFSFVEIDGRDICMLIVESAPRAVYVEDAGQSKFFIRSGNSTRHLDVREAMIFAKNRWD